MKVKIKYYLLVEKEIEMRPEEYCHLHANSDYGDYFPKESIYRGMSIDDKADEELTNFFFDRKVEK